MKHLKAIYGKQNETFMKHITDETRAVAVFGQEYFNSQGIHSALSMDGRAWKVGTFLAL